MQALATRLASMPGGVVAAFRAPESTMHLPARVV